ncbi:MAG: cellulase family glycosylhydrolase [Candidatus Coatesbacteria bacterium]
MTADARAGAKVDPATLARGINMDHLFNPYRDPREPWTAADMKAIEKDINPAEFKLAAKLGFTHVRLNIGQVFLQDQQVPFAFREDGFRLLDRAVEAIGTSGLACVLDLHQIPVPPLELDPREKRKFTALWKRLTTRYRGSKTFIAFELLNEPRVRKMDWWRSFTAEQIQMIRRLDPHRTVIITAPDWAGFEELMQLGNLGIPNVLYTFHFYEPFVFTHQGADWGEPGMASLREIRYPIDPEQMKTELAKAKGTDEECWPFTDWPRAADAAALEKRLQPLFDWAKHERIALYCGEFGVHKPYAPPADRARWIADLVAILKKHDVGWAMWSWHSGFDLVDDHGVPDPAVVEALGLR